MVWPLSAGITGSCAACALWGSLRAPSASTSTRSASTASVPKPSDGAHSFPAAPSAPGARVPTQTTRVYQSACSTSSSVGSSRSGQPSGASICVDVAMTTVHPSSRASSFTRVDLPPLPTTDRTPLSVRSKSARFMRNPYKKSYALVRQREFPLSHSIPDETKGLSFCLISAQRYTLVWLTPDVV
jgi:hypothetical protein